MMDEVLLSIETGQGRSIHIATLARETVIRAEAEHLGFSGYFLFETSALPGHHGIEILGKTVSFEAALRLADLLAQQESRIAALA